MERNRPFQVMLPEDQHRQLHALAERRGTSMGSLIRESVAAYLSDGDIADDPLMGIIGAFEDLGPRPHGDVGEEHDAYLAKIIGAEETTGEPATGDVDA